MKVKRINSYYVSFAVLGGILLTFYFSHPKKSNFINDLIIQYEAEKDCDVFSDTHENPTVYYDFDQALEVARKEKRQLLVYFNRTTCVNCRSFEENVLFGSRLQEDLVNEYVFAVLFNDLKCPLISEGEKYSSTNGKKITRIGGYNNHLQVSISRYGENPIISIIDTNKMLVENYVPDLKSVRPFHLFLEKNSQKLR